ncbi:hypothetical protein HYU17_05130 [Candidatus Woesearchaeota archaeon]|nr:hypothetical protein [Candidatus Woesearchaeota archaeon]
MVTMTADVTEGVKKMTKKLVKAGLYKSQSEVVRDAIRQLAFKYDIKNAPSLEEVRKITAKAVEKTGKTLAQTVRELRDED